MGRLKPSLGAAAAALVLALAAAPAGAADVNCHTVSDRSCRTVGPHALPLSVPEFNRLAAQTGATAEGGGALLLFALLNAGENPALAAELLASRLQADDGGMVRAFVEGRRQVAARCAAGFVVGAKSPQFRYDSNAVAFRVRRADGGQGAAATIGLCSASLGCIPIEMTRDPDRGWVAKSADPLIRACGKS